VFGPDDQFNLSPRAEPRSCDPAVFYSGPAALNGRIGGRRRRAGPARSRLRSRPRHGRPPRRGRRRIAAAPPVESHLPQPPGRTSLISQRRNGDFASGASAEPSISADGRYVAFTSVAQDLLNTGPAANEPGNPWIFVRDRDRGRTIRLPLPANFPDGQSRDPAISADGNVVAFTFQSFATGLAAAPGSLVLAWDRATGKTEIVSRNTKGGPADRSREPSVSKTGRYVAFTSDNPSIARADGRLNPDVFRYDRRNETTDWISGGTIGGSPQNVSNSPSISADGASSRSSPSPGRGGLGRAGVRTQRPRTTSIASARSGRRQAERGLRRASDLGDRPLRGVHGVASDLVPGDSHHRSMSSAATSGRHDQLVSV
jgi:hypothetical protein